jgi:hypothetical protein
MPNRRHIPVKLLADIVAVACRAPSPKSPDYRRRRLAGAIGKGGADMRMAVTTLVVQLAALIPDVVPVQASETFTGAGVVIAKREGKR